MISVYEGWTIKTDGFGRIAELCYGPMTFTHIDAREFCGKVAAYFNVELAKILGKRRDQHTAFVRQVAAYLLREMTDLPFTDIGGVLNRDHSTIIHAHNLIGARVAKEPAFAATIRALQSMLGTV